MTQTSDKAARVSFDGRYPWPYSRTRPRGVRNIDWPHSLGSDCLRSYGYYIAPGFSFQRTLNRLGGPFYEIGGPSEDGYRMLSRVRFPEPVVITNVCPQEGVHELVDIFDPPFADESVSMLLASCIISTSFAQHAAVDGMNVPETGPRAHRIDRLVRRSNYALGNDLVRLGRLAETPSARLATFWQAMRVLRPGGLLLYHGFSDKDMAIVTGLGFTLMAHTHAVELHEAPDEVLLQKPWEVS